MDTNANAYPFEADQLSDAIEECRSLLVLQIVTAYLTPLNILPALILTLAPVEGSYIVLSFALTEFFIQLVSMLFIYRSVDVACHPKEMSWIAAFIIAALGIVYPVYLHSSKLLWVMIMGWVMLAISVLITALQYYFYLVVKGFSHKSIQIFPVTTEEKV